MAYTVTPDSNNKV